VTRVGNVLECELHGSQFEPGTGAVVTGPAARALFRYEATESNNGIYVTVRNNV
jgi:Rieske Fe-S protein